jgi:anti-sigma factor RsiW
MTCLGERITTLTDGELGHDARDRALSHVASCPRCRAALDGERSLKARLAHAPTPAPSDALTRRLLRLAEPGDPLPPPTPRMPGTPRPAPLPAPGRPLTGHGVFAAGSARRPDVGATAPTRAGVMRRVPQVAHVPGSPPRRTRRRVLASVGALSMLGAALGGALVLGSATQPPAVRPAVARFSLEHAATAQLPLRDPAANAVTAGLGQRSVLPEERSR